MQVRWSSVVLNQTEFYSRDRIDLPETHGPLGSPPTPLALGIGRNGQTSPSVGGRSAETLLPMDPSGGVQL